MASKVGIMNRALGLVGDEPITSPTEDSEPARIMNRFYDDSRRAVLRAHPWNSAVRRISLAKLSASPAWGFDNQFQLPAEALRVLQVSKEKSTFKIEGRRLLSDSDTVEILYIKDITDPNEFDPLLLDVFAARLASDVAYRLTASRTLASDLWEMYLAKLREARKIDAQEGTPEDLVIDPNDDWIEARWN